MSCGMQSPGATAALILAGGKASRMGGGDKPLLDVGGSSMLTRVIADDDDQHSILRDTLRVFLHEGGSFKATAERLTLHKNTVQYRVRKAEESLGRPVGEDRLNVGLALLASRWLGAAVLRPAGAPRP